MSEQCNYKDIKDYKTAFDCFVQRFLVKKKSIFRLDNNDTILDENSIKYLVDNFIDNGYSGKASFIEKIKHQLVTKPKMISTNDEVIKNAIEVLAHIVWLWRLVPSNASKQSTINSVDEVLKLHSSFENIQLNNNFFNKSIKGIAKTGTYYNTNKPFELAFVIKFLEEYLKDTYRSKINILTSIEHKVSITTMGDISSTGEFNIKEKSINEPKTASIFNALLYFFEPTKYEAILSNGHKTKILKAFEDLICDSEAVSFEPEIDWQLKCIKDKLSPDYKKINFFYQPNIRKLWDGNNIELNTNIIYFGAPGTGKTYSVLKEVNELTERNNKYFKVVQFHPNYGYEDFIEGIKPTGIKNNTLEFKLKNGIFKEMCIEAFKELIQAKKDEREAKKFYFIADEINRAELSRVFGELLLCIEEDKRLKIEDNQVVKKSALIELSNASLWEKEHAVVILNNKGKIVDLDDDNKYISDGNKYFGVPENIKFIGTMNDIDRSIESFDLALRRRFIWIKKETSYKVIKDYLINDYGIDDNSYIDSCKKINREIQNIIGKNYQLGHSYFMKITPIGQIIPAVSKKILFNTELKPVLEEYLRTILNEETIQQHLEVLMNSFVSEKK